MFVGPAGKWLGLGFKSIEVELISKLILSTQTKDIPPLRKGEKSSELSVSVSALANQLFVGGGESKPKLD